MRSQCSPPAKGLALLGSRPPSPAFSERLSGGACAVVLVTSCAAGSVGRGPGGEAGGGRQRTGKPAWRKPTSRLHAFVQLGPLRADMGPSNLPTQLQFNKDVPSLPANLAIRYSGPRPIVIEKLRAPGRASTPGLPEGPGRQPWVPFSVVSEEKLNLAIHLAKRDVKKKQLQEVLGRVPHGQPRGPPKSSPGRSELTKKSRGLPAKQRSSRLETAGPRAKVYLSRGPRSHSPPTRDPGPQPRGQPQAAPSQSLLELRRLQRELSACLQRIDGLGANDRPEQGLDPEEAERSRVRRQEQAVRTGRTLYALQQQVKEIQEELDKLSPHRIRHTRKSRAMSRLGAAQRGAIRALQMFVSQFADSREQAVSERYRELGGLIRQLSLCSARLDADPAVPDVVVDLLQQIEELESLLERKRSLGKLKKSFPGARSQSPPAFPAALERSFSASPVRERKPSVAKEKLPQPGRRPVVRRLLGDEAPFLAANPLRPASEGPGAQPREELPSWDQSAAFRGGPAPTKAKAVKKRPLTAPASLRRRGLEPAGKPPQGFHKADRPRPRQAQGKDCRFQRTTVSFRLKKSHPPVKDRRVPWIPPNPTSPPASPKCVAWAKVSAGPDEARREAPLQQEPAREDGARPEPSEREALRELARRCPKTRVGRGKRRSCLAMPLAPSLQTRLAWLDAESARRMKELDELRDRELAAVRRLSASPSQLADKVEQVVLERLKPLLDQEAESWGTDARLGEHPSEPKAPVLEKAPPAPGPEHAALWEDDGPDLRLMMQRMEEIEQYQEAVRQRFTQMVYADLDFGTTGGRSDRKGRAVNERPRPPQPIQLSKGAAPREPQVSILLAEPLDEKCFDDSTDMEEGGEKRTPLPPVAPAAPQQPEGSLLLSVPREALRSLGDYQDGYQQYLRTISHESIGSFNPWIIVERAHSARRPPVSPAAWQKSWWKKPWRTWRPNSRSCARIMPRPCSPLSSWRPPNEGRGRDLPPTAALGSVPLEMKPASSVVALWLALLGGREGPAGTRRSSSGDPVSASGAGPGAEPAGAPRRGWSREGLRRRQGRGSGGAWGPALGEGRGGPAWSTGTSRALPRRGRAGETPCSASLWRDLRDQKSLVTFV
ncbi:protein moonraker isoform X2 [Antechinus flavipes]|uniref:protein moonraker isoform X2 n=1 Tax=Antechinus flavipes TaxID=38775 RepID=UPI002236784D|nr:protein moonraker isoform X2 [Antechinus flavipes]